MVSVVVALGLPHKRFKNERLHMRCLEPDYEGKTWIENDSLLIVAQNDIIRTNYFKVKIDDSQNSKFLVVIEMKQLITW